MRNLSMLTDLYELTMMSGYLNENMENRIAVFDMFIRGQKGTELCAYGRRRAAYRLYR